MTDETILTNAILVTPQAALHGTLVVRDGCIAEVESGPSSALTAQSLDGDYLIPGIVDTHRIEVLIQHADETRMTTTCLEAR